MPSSIYIYKYDIWNVYDEHCEKNIPLHAHLLPRPLLVQRPALKFPAPLSSTNSTADGDSSESFAPNTETLSREYPQLQVTFCFTRTEIVWTCMNEGISLWHERRRLPFNILYCQFQMDDEQNDVLKLKLTRLSTTTNHSSTLQIAIHRNPFLNSQDQWMAAGRHISCNTFNRH